MDDAYPHETESLCPVCLKRIKASRALQGDDVFMIKECEEHGPFKTVLWRGRPAMSNWRRPKPPVRPELCYGSVEKGCPFDCGLCEAHVQLPCSVLIEVTDRCNLKCPFCFADSGNGETEDLSLDKISHLLGRAMAAAGPCNLQLSGGEPTLREDLPDIVRIARQTGYSFIQANTNGLGLASDKTLGMRLREAGLSSIFLQFDGTHDAIHRSMRGSALFNEKLQAIKNCGEAGLGVVLVPTLVKGINTYNIGAIVRQALQLSPTVRGVHFQPVGYFGRFPGQAQDQDRFTLPELMRCLEEQTEGLIRVSDLSPPGCEHALCSFHATYMRSTEYELRLIGAHDGDCCSLCTGEEGVRKTVNTVSRRWVLPTPAATLNPFTMAKETGPCCENHRHMTRAEAPLDLDAFLKGAAVSTFTISAMAFQDAENIDLERLRGCCISVISPDGRLIPFCAYNLTDRNGKGLYRRQQGSGPQ